MQNHDHCGGLKIIYRHRRATTIGWCAKIIANTHHHTSYLWGVIVKPSIHYLTCLSCELVEKQQETDLTTCCMFKHAISGTDEQEACASYLFAPFLHFNMFGVQIMRSAYSWQMTLRNVSRLQEQTKPLQCQSPGSVYLSHESSY